MSDGQQPLESRDPLQRRFDGIAAEPRFVIGRGRRGGWIVDDRLGIVGGIFVSESAARHYAYEESGGCPDQIAVIEAWSMDLKLRVVA
jgi:hypothetical protein